MALPTPWFPISETDFLLPPTNTVERIHFCCFKPPSLSQFVAAASGHDYNICFLNIHSTHTHIVQAYQTDFNFKCTKPTTQETHFPNNPLILILQNGLTLHLATLKPGCYLQFPFFPQSYIVHEDILPALPPNSPQSVHFSPPFLLPLSSKSLPLLSQTVTLATSLSATTPASLQQLLQATQRGLLKILSGIILLPYFKSSPQASSIIPSKFSCPSCNILYDLTSLPFSLTSFTLPSVIIFHSPGTLTSFCSQNMPSSFLAQWHRIPSSYYFKVSSPGIHLTVPFTSFRSQLKCPILEENFPDHPNHCLCHYLIYFIFNYSSHSVFLCISFTCTA